MLVFINFLAAAAFWKFSRGEHWPVALLLSLPQQDKPPPHHSVSDSDSKAPDPGALWLDSQARCFLDTL
jgi:hypothetical protein